MWGQEFLEPTRWGQNKLDWWVGTIRRKQRGSAAVQQKVRLALCASLGTRRTEIVLSRQVKRRSQCPTTATNQRVLG
jgi:hypothetical protein